MALRRTLGMLRQAKAASSEPVAFSQTKVARLRSDDLLHVPPLTPGQMRLRRGIVIIGSAFLVAVIYDMATGSKLGAEWLIPPSGPMAPENPDEARAATESLAKLPTTPAAAAEAAAKAAAAAAQSKSA